MREEFKDSFLNYEIRNRLIGSGVVLSKVYKKIIMLSICQNDNLISGKNMVY